MNIKQTPERKEKTKRYCKKHGLHYFDNCPACFIGQQKIKGC